MSISNKYSILHWCHFDVVVVQWDRPNTQLLVTSFGGSFKRLCCCVFGVVVFKSSCRAVVCHRRQPLDCINHPAEYLQCTQLVPTGRLDCAVGYEYESWTSEGIVCEPACQCHSRSQWTCQSKCPLSLTASQYSWLAVVLRPLADRSTSRDIGVRNWFLAQEISFDRGGMTAAKVE